MAVFQAIHLAWTFVTTMVLLAAVALTTLGICAVFRWWDDWRFRMKAPPSEEGGFIAGKDEEE